MIRYQPQFSFDDSILYVGTNNNTEGSWNALEANVAKSHKLDGDFGFG